MTTFNEYLKEQLKDENEKKAYDALEPDFAIIRAMIEARLNSGITQKELSERSGIAQGDISKLERGNGNPSLKTLKRLAEAMDMTLKIEFVPKSADTGSKKKRRVKQDTASAHKTKNLSRQRTVSAPATRLSAAAKAGKSR